PVASIVARARAMRSRNGPDAGVMLMTPFCRAVPQASWPSYALTTVAQPLDRMVAETVNLLRSYLRDNSLQPAQTVVLPGELKIRSSVQRKLAPIPVRLGKRRNA
ncbi:MAG: hypothetical protein EBX67_09920, partial [Betaproteobacteria bacterium]|nr:hypothetical protein [Betaproteobacteria bacterium]